MEDSSAPGIRRLSRQSKTSQNEEKTSVQSDVNLATNPLESISEPKLDRIHSEERVRARSAPVHKTGSNIPAEDERHEVRFADENDHRESRISIKPVVSKSLEAVFGGRASKSRLITRLDLFKEAMYTSIHFLGHITDRYPSNQKDLALYTMANFSRDSKEQESVLDHVRSEAFPLTIVHTVVRRAERLAGRNTYTFANPYCFVGLETMDSLDRKDWKTINLGSPLRPRRSSYPTKDRVRPLAEKRFNQLYSNLPAHVRTSIESQTANPIWDQRFQCCSLRPSVDTLTVEVWDHDDEKSVLRAIKNAKDVKRTQAVETGVGNELEEAFYKGKRDDFMGKVTLQIRDIPVDGQERWFNLSGKSHRGDDAVGRILLQVWLTHAFRHGKHFEEYAEPKVMLERFWDHILQIESDKYGKEWTGDIPIAATCLIFQYGLQTGLSDATQAIIRWNAYTKHHLGLYGVGPRLRELDSVLNRVYQEESDHQRNAELETSMIVLCIERLCPVIRNHLRETQERVEEALKSITHCRNVLSKYKSESTVARINWLVEASLKMSVLEWYDAKYYEIVHSQHITEKHELVGGVSLVMTQVNVILGEGQSKWKTLFWMEGFEDYMPIVYEEFQKMVIHDVEGLAWSILQNYDDNDRLRQVLLKWTPTAKAYENGWAVCQALFKLFVETQTFVSAQENIFEEGETSPYSDLNEYHLWFRPVLIMWIGFAFIRSCEMTTKATQLDDVLTEDSFVKVSSSAIDTASILLQLVNFWKELNWPDAPEGYVVIHFLIDMTCRIALLYTQLHKNKIKKEGYFDTEDRFDVSDRLCTAFNNIEYVKEAAMKVPEQLKMTKLLDELDKSLGEAVCKEYKVNIENTLMRTASRIEKLFDDILNSVGDRVRPEIRMALEQCATMLEKGIQVQEEALHVLFSYLEDNLQVLDKSLLDYNFKRFLQMFWNVVCEELCKVAKGFPISSISEQVDFITKLQQVFPHIMKYFEGGLMEEELVGPQSKYESANKLLALLTVETQQLIHLYYGQRAQEQIKLKEKPEYGTLQVNISFWHGKLNVHIVNARNLLPMDLTGFIFKTKPSSDPFVEMELLPETNFHEPDLRMTQTKSRTLNPDFDENFVWNVSLAECQNPNATIRFTCQDYDVVTKNDFLGEAFVPLSQIPGIVEHGALQQPMTLQLRVYNPDNQIIEVLKSRYWDVVASEFVLQQMDRTIK